MKISAPSLQLVLADQIAKFYADPLGFVKFAYPWGEPGALEQWNGPDKWQTEVLKDIGKQVRERRFDGVRPVNPIRVAISSGHGIGKTSLAAWIVDWIMSTRPFSQGTVTANTYQQLGTKTWAGVKFWTKLCITSGWFTLNNDRMYRNGHDDSWFCSPQTCREENSEAFAGQHAAGSTSFYLLDESSAIPEKIWEVLEGGLTDGEPMVFALGNATRNDGKFYRINFGNERSHWTHRSIDSRECKMSNKELIGEWVEMYGEDSDFVRVRVRGLPPRASDAQFIDMQRVIDAQKRHVAVLPDEPLVAGCDMAWGGSDDNVVRFRCGADARSIKPIRIKGEFTRDPQILVNRLADVLRQEYEVNGISRRVAKLFLDSAGIAGPVAQRLRSLGFGGRVLEINFGAHSPDNHYAYYRDYMWGEMKQWLLTGAISQDAELESDLVAPGVVSDKMQRVKLEPKEAMQKRGIDSPDDGDALALTFAMPVAPPRRKPEPESLELTGEPSLSWMG